MILGLTCAALLAACADASPDLPCGLRAPETPPAPLVGDTPTVTSRDQMEISGSRDPWSAIYVNGVEEIPLGCDRFWTLTVDLADGPDFTFTAVGDLGNVSTPVTVNITRDTAAPAAPGITAPADDSATPGTATVTGTREAGARVLLNGLPLVPPGPATAFTASVPLPAAGANSLSFTQVDEAGNAGFITAVTVTRASVPLPPPRMNYPLQDDRVGAASSPGSDVTFYWFTVAGAAEYRVEVSPSPDFATLTTSITVAAGAGPEQSALWGTAPNGVHYWRLGADDTAGAGGAVTFGQTRRFSVGNARNDVNGDRFADVAVGAPADDGLSLSIDDNRGRVDLFYGKENIEITSPPTGESPSVVYQGTAIHANFGIELTMGDLNGDGFADLVAGSTKENSNAHSSGAARVFFGGDPPDTTPDLSLFGQNFEDFFGTAIASGFDLNRDGYDDLAVTAYGYDAPGAADAGRVYLFFGGNPMDGVPDRIFTGDTYIGYLGSSIAAADMNADGWPDLALGEPNTAVPDGAGGTLAEAGRVRVYFGGPQMDEQADLILPGVDAGEHLGEALARTGDMNGDGLDMLAAGAPTWGTALAPVTGKVRLFAAGLIPALTTAQAMEIQGTGANEAFGLRLSGGGDVNGDGYADLAVGVPYSDVGAPSATEGDLGRVDLHLGAATLDSNRDARVVGIAANDWVGWSVQITSDVNGDTFGDLVFSAPGNDDTVPIPPINNTGRAWVLPGEPGGLPSWNAAGCLGGFPGYCTTDQIIPGGALPGAILPGTEGGEWLGLALW